MFFSFDQFESAQLSTRHMRVWERCGSWARRLYGHEGLVSYPTRLFLPICSFSDTPLCERCAQVGLGDVYEHLRTLLPEPEPELEEGEEAEAAAPISAERAGQSAPEATPGGALSPATVQLLEAVESLELDLVQRLEV